jgi:hypothetical protein
MPKEPKNKGLQAFRLFHLIENEQRLIRLSEMKQFDVKLVKRHDRLQILKGNIHKKYLVV